MSHVSISKSILIKYPKLQPKPKPKPTTQSTLAEVLQSEPVKRLLNQPNIVIQTIPSACVNSGLTGSNDVPVTVEKKDGSSKATHIKNIKPEISIMPVESKSKDGSRLLPSKGDGKSEISLFVVKPEKKSCGHCEPCENIICDVAVQQYIDQSGVLPMLAVGIQDDEINAPVSKHCKNPLCDALSIEHNRCRRALVKLHRCDEICACDICGVVFKTRRAKISHRNCIRKEVYRHNQSNGAQILREKMRERELQMIHAAKIKKKSYMDPAMEYKKTMETLRNNKELIIIPKSIPLLQPTVTITTVSSNNRINPPENSSSKEIFGKLLPSIPIKFPPQQVVVGKSPEPEVNDGPPIKQPKIAITSCRPTQTSEQPYVKVTSVSQPNLVQSVSFNDWIVSQANIVTSEPNKTLRPYLTPIRVVPITSLKSAPSLRHQTHGIPAFCLVPDKLAKLASPTKLQTFQPALVKSNPSTPIENEKQNLQTIKTTSKVQKSQAQRKFEEKNSKVFKCLYCLKGFSTDWYFKMHVAGHTGEMLFSCKTCEKPFSNRYDMKKHILNEHNDGECRCEICGQISICKSALEIHIRSHTGEKPFHCTECDMSYRSSTDLKTHRRKQHGFTDCPYCRLHFIKVDLQAHLVLYHHLTEDEALHEIQQTRNRNVNGNESSEIEPSDSESNKSRSISIEEEPIEKVICGSNKAQSNCNNQNLKKKKFGNKSGVRKLKKNRVKNLRLNRNNSTVLKKIANNKKKTETKHEVRRSLRSSNSTFQCLICKENFDNATLLDNHLATKPKGAVQCCECKSLFHSQTDYKKHNSTSGKSSCQQLCEYIM